jgi:hypothetical protein
MDNNSLLSEEERQEALRQEGHKKNLAMVAEAKKNAVKTSITDRIRFTGSMIGMAMTEFVDELKPKTQKRNGGHNFNSFPAHVESLEQLVLMTAGPVDVMTDDFSGDLEQWNVDTRGSNADIHIEDGELVAANLGAVVTKEDFRGTAEAPITVSGTWKPIRDDASNTHSMTLRLRSNGDAINYRGQNGVYLVAYTNNDVFIGQWKDGVHTKLAEDKSRPLDLGKTYNFSVTDNGSEVTAIITNEQGVEVINLTGQSPSDIAAGEKVVLQARERGMSRFDNFRISTLVEQPEEVITEEVAPEAAEVDAVFADPDAVAEILSFPSTVEAEFVGPVEATYPDTPEGRLQALAARQAAYQEQINVLSLQKTDIETLIARNPNIVGTYQAELAYIQSQIDTLERSKVPYSALHVNPSTDAGVFDVHYMSNRTSTYFEVFKQGTPGTSYTQLIEHPAGEMDGSTSFNMRRAQQGRGHGDVRIVMYSDASKTERLDEFTGHYNSRGGLVSGETNAVWGELETGRIVENPIEPQMSIQKITGPNILVQYQTPHDGARIVLEGGGLFATKNLSHEGGEDFESTMLTFNSSNREWNYRLQLFENRNNTVVAEYSFHWDPASKQLTLNGDNTPIEIEADSDNEVKRDVMQNVFDTQTGITTIDVSYASLRQVQGTHMYEASSLYIDPDDAGTYVNNYPIAGHPDANGIFMQLLDSYEGALEEMLQDAAKIKVAAMNGDSQLDAEEYLRWNHHRISILRHFSELAIDFGVHLPSVEAIRDEGIRIFESNTDDFVTQQVKNVTMRKREALLADRKEESGGVLVGGGGGEVEGGSVVLSEQEVEEHIQNTIADRVTARLNERLSNMTIQERAEARGLIRLQQQGRLNEYLEEILMNKENGTTEESTNETNINAENVTFSFLVSRPLQETDKASHNFIVVNARYRGDPNATVYSYGQNDNGRLGRVDHLTTNPGSDTTHQADIDAWLSLKGPLDPANPVQLQLIPATNDVVSSLAQSLIEDHDYSMIAGIFGANSNSAAQAIANAAAGMQIPVPETDRSSWGSSSYDKIQFTIPSSY